MMDSEVAKLENQNANTKSSRCPHWSYCLLVLIILIVSVAFSLVLLPHILADYRSITSTDPLSCSPVPYTGSMCLSELIDWQRCLPERVNVSEDVLIPSTIDQSLAESQASMLFGGLQFVQPSDECEEEFREFWCLLLFRVCDEDGQVRAPSYEQCNTLQTDTCREVYEFAATVPEFSIIIQNCNNFRLGLPPPCENESINDEVRPKFNVSCSSGFFYDEAALICKPKCGEWTPLSPSMHTVSTTVLIAGDVISILISISILILSFIQYKQIFTFPLVLIIYSTVVVLVVVLVDFVSFLPYKSLFCESDDLLRILSDSSSNTIFCQFQGMLFLYATLTISFLWVFQTAVYFWIVNYPMHFNSFKSSGKLKTIHLVSVIVSFTLPALPILAIGTRDGFGLGIFVPNKCIFHDVDGFAYSFSLPFAILVICGISLLINTLWRVGRVMSRLQGKQTVRQGSRISTAELKLILILVAYMIVALHSMLSANITLSHINTHFETLGNHFICESLGDDTIECPRDGFELLESDSLVQTFVYVIFGIYPAIFFIFLISPRMFVNCCRKKFLPPTSQTATSSQA